MSHTNSTANYSLPQFISTDKPAWLTDVNNAYSAIDTAIKAASDAAIVADGKATSAQTTANAADLKIGALTDLQTDVKTSIVNAINSNILQDINWDLQNVMHARRYGNIVFVRIQAQVSANANGWVYLGTLPASYRPDETEYDVVFDNQLYHDMARPARIDGTGDVYVYTPEAITNHEYRGVMTYII